METVGAPPPSETALRPPRHGRRPSRLAHVARRGVNHDRALEAMLVGAQAAGLFASVVVARSVGPTGRGTVVTITVWGQLLGWLAAFSLDKALMVLASDGAAAASSDDALRATRIPVLGTSALAAVAALFLGSHFFTSIWFTLALAALAVATAQGELVAGWLLARGRRQNFIYWRLLQPALYLVIVSCAALLLRSATTTERTVVIAIGAAASMVGPVACALAVLPRHPLMVTRGIRSLLKFGAAAHAAGILQFLNARLDMLVLTLIVSPGRLGQYAVGAGLGQLALLTATAGFIRGITGQSKATDFIGIGIAAALGLLVIIAAPLLIPLVFGPSFQPAVPIARILAIGGVVNYALLATSGRLLSRRQPWTVALSQGVGVALFGIGIAVSPTLQGAAWSSVVSFAASLLVAQVALRLPAAPIAKEANG